MRIIQNVRQFLRREPDIQGQKNSARFQNALIGFQQALAIQAEKSNSVAGFHARIPQGAAETSRTFGELRIVKALVSANYGSFMRELLLGIPQESHRGKGNIHGLRSLPGGLTSIHDKNVTSHIIGCVGGEKNSRAFQIVFAAESSHGNL